MSSKRQQRLLMHRVGSTHMVGQIPRGQLVASLYIELRWRPPLPRHYGEFARESLQIRQLFVASRGSARQQQLLWTVDQACMWTGGNASGRVVEMSMHARHFLDTEYVVPLCYVDLAEGGTQRTKLQAWTAPDRE
jgi:hypothetical protein